MCFGDDGVADARHDGLGSGLYLSVIHVGIGQLGEMIEIDKVRVRVLLYRGTDIPNLRLKGWHGPCRRERIGECVDRRRQFVHSVHINGRLRQSIAS